MEKDIDTELSKISIFLGKPDSTFESIINESKASGWGLYDFEHSNSVIKFYCKQFEYANHNSPPWIDFVNQKLENNQIEMPSSFKRPSGLLLIKISNRLLAATFGTNGKSIINKGELVPDFGIITAMNMCGNDEIRQIKSSIHSFTTKNINRQTSKPSDTFTFGFHDDEYIKFISAHLKENKNITLQGKESLTLKIIGEKKISWDKLIKYGEKFIKKYESKDYKNFFPNYANLQDVPKERVEDLDAQLVEELLNKNFERIHLAIPEFIEDDEYSFSYSCFPSWENKYYSHIDIADLHSKCVPNKNIDINLLKKKYIYLYTHEFDRILKNRKWSLYNCIVAEVQHNGNYYILSDGNWKKIDNDYYELLNSFIQDKLPEIDVSDDYHNFNIADKEKKNNCESIFNSKYCEKNEQAFKFDAAKLKIGEGKKQYEFCDIFEINGNSASIIHVKRHGGANSINYLFSQARFYCEFFLNNSKFLNEIRNYIYNSDNSSKDLFHDYIKEDIEDINGKDYEVNLWLLYDNKKTKPQKTQLPLSAKYELKITYEILRKILKFKAVYLSMIPVKIIKITGTKKGNGKKE